MGRGWLDVVHSADRERTIAAWTAAVENGELDVEFRLHRAVDGEWVWHRTTSLPVRDEAGRIIEWLGSTTDIQSYKNLQRRQAETMAAVERHARELQAEIERREQAESKLRHAAYHDDLTGLFNRAWFIDQFRQAQSGEGRREHSMLFLDLDRFKLINDSFGHSVGDLLLRAVAERLQNCIAHEGMLARLGGDEFAFLVREGGVGAALRHATRIQDAMRRPFKVGAHEVTTTCSIGVAHSAPGHSKVKDLIRDAGVAMHDAKASGWGGCVVFTGAMRDRAASELRLQTELSHALSRGDFELRYQPICDVGGSAIVGVEALVRWRHVEYGDVSPSTFIPMAEKAGLIRSLGQWVFRKGCAQVRAWHERYPSIGLCLSVNASPDELRDSRYLQDVEEMLAATGFDPARLQVEVTESVFLQQTESTDDILDGLRRLGVRVALDDFGTGYSSLGYLSRYPVDTLKIDRSFVSGMLTQERTRAVVEGIIRLGHAMGISVVAEGVEEQDQLLTLQASGCDLVQGYLLAQPLLEDELEAVLDRQERGLPLTSLQRYRS